MKTRWLILAQIIVVVAISLAVRGADAGKAPAVSPAAPDRPPHGVYECWPAEDQEPSPGPLA